MREIESIVAAGSLRVPVQVIASIEEARSLLLQSDSG